MSIQNFKSQLSAATNSEESPAIRQSNEALREIFAPLPTKSTVGTRKARRRS